MKPTCQIDGCAKPARSGRATMCPMHYHRWYRHGDPNKVATGSGITVSKGRRYKSTYKPGHPMASKTGMAWAHRVVLYDTIGYGPHQCHWCKELVTWGGRSKYAVQADHLDGDGSNNHPDNLVPSCASCNTMRGGGARSKELARHGWFSSHDTVHVTGGRRCTPEMLTPIT